MLQKNTREVSYFMEWWLFSAINKCNVFIHTRSQREPHAEKPHNMHTQAKELIMDKSIQLSL